MGTCGREIIGYIWGIILPMAARSEQTNSGNDFRWFGFATKASQRGIIKLTIGMFVAIIFSQQAWYQYQGQVKDARYDKMVEKFTNALVEKDKASTEIYKQLLFETFKTKRSFDSTIQK